MTPFPFSESCRLPSENKKRENFKKRSFEISSGSSRRFLFYLWKKKKKNKTSSLSIAIIINYLIKNKYLLSVFIDLTLLKKRPIIANKYGMNCSSSVFISVPFSIPRYQE